MESTNLIDRRNALRTGVGLLALPAIASLGSGRSQAQTGASTQTTEQAAAEADGMQIQYLEIVTAEVDSTCTLYEKVHGVSFGEADQVLGGARTAKLANGGMLGIRAPLRETEEPVVRSYFLVEDIKAAVQAAADAGAEVALSGMELPGHGTCAIVIHGGIEIGFWQV